MRAGQETGPADQAGSGFCCEGHFSRSLHAQFLHDEGRGAEAGKGALNHVGADEQREPVPVGTVEHGQQGRDDDHAAGEDKDGFVDGHFRVSSRNGCDEFQLVHAGELDMGGPGSEVGNISLVYYQSLIYLYLEDNSNKKYLIDPLQGGNMRRGSS